MAQKTLLKQGTIVTGSNKFTGDVLLENGKIAQVDSSISSQQATEINCEGKYIMPGMIDTHVHFRDPGLTHKGDALTESRAAVAGGVTTIFDMPNTLPQALTVDIVHEKQALYAQKSLVNFGFYIGASKTNLEELKKADSDNSIPAIKIFMAESTGEMTLAEDEFLEPIFRDTKKLIATHAEDETRRIERLEAYKNGTLEEAKGMAADNPYLHTIIRDNLTASQGTKHAIDLAEKYNHRLHILHMSAKEELPYLVEAASRKAPNGDVLVTGETCPHYLQFNREDIHEKKGYLIMNPALKGADDSAALWKAVQDGLITQITTDHAPHLIEEKEQPYGKLPSGTPGVQFALPFLLHAAAEGKITLEQVVQLYCENAAKNYRIENKGKLEAGFDADVIIVDPEKELHVTKDVILSACGWSPFEGFTFKGGSVIQTFVNGNSVFENGSVKEENKGVCIMVS